MNSNVKTDRIREVSRGLSIIKCFTNRKIYKTLRESCLMQIPVANTIKNFGKVRLKNKPTIADFFVAISEVGTFVLNKDNWSFEKPTVELNSRGMHSESIIACMDILLRNKDFQCMEEFCNLLDDDDSNEKAKSVKKMLMSTRNNMIAPKGREEREPCDIHSKATGSHIKESKEQTSIL